MSHWAMVKYCVTISAPQRKFWKVQMNFPAKNLNFEQKTLTQVRLTQVRFVRLATCPKIRYDEIKG